MNMRHSASRGRGIGLETERPGTGRGEDYPRIKERLVLEHGSEVRESVPELCLCLGSGSSTSKEPCLHSCSTPQDA